MQFKMCAVAMLVVLQAGMFLSCRSEHSGSLNTESPDAGSGGFSASVVQDGGQPADNSDVAPDTLRSVPVFSHEPDASPDMMPSTGNPEYVTDILLYAGCEMDTSDVAVAKGHAVTSNCERIVLTPAHDDGDGNFYEVWASFGWSVGDPSVASIECLNGPHDNFCWPVGLKDTFDDDWEQEPHTLVTACVQNDCPMLPPDVYCPKTLCALVQVKVVTNIEAWWSFTGATFADGGSLTNLTQVGRGFADSLIGLKHGWINGPYVNFMIDDFVYEGTIDHTRNTVNGTVWESLSLNQVGTWQATRLP